MCTIQKYVEVVAQVKYCDQVFFNVEAYFYMLVCNKFYSLVSYGIKYNKIKKACRLIRGCMTEMLRENECYPLCQVDGVQVK